MSYAFHVATCHQPAPLQHAPTQTFRCRGRLFNIACRTVADRIPSSSPSLRSVLELFDADGDGRLTLSEVQQALEAWQAQSGTASGTGSPTPSSTSEATTYTTSLAPATTASLATPATPSTRPTKPEPSAPVSWELQLLHGWQAACTRGQSPVSALLSYMAGKLGNNGKARATASDLLWSFCGMFLAVTALGVMNMYVRTWPMVGEWHQQGLGLLLGSFGTLCVLIFGRPEAEAVRLWNFLAGHVVATFTVLALLHVIGPSILSRALAMAFMIGVMLFTDSVHPPGGALVLMAVDSAAIQRIDWWFMLYPSLAVTIAVLLPLGIATNWLKRNIKFDFPAAPAAPSGASNAGPVPELKPKMA